MRDTFATLNQNGVEFLLTDLDVAMTFLDVAETSQVEETRRRNLNNAREACDSILHLLEKLGPDSIPRQEVNTGLSQLETRLKAVCHQLDQEHSGMLE